jgi:hypothetical protein
MIGQSNSEPHGDAPVSTEQDSVAKMLPGVDNRAVKFKKGDRVG